MRYSGERARICSFLFGYRKNINYFENFILIQVKINQIRSDNEMDERNRQSRLKEKKAIEYKEYSGGKIIIDNGNGFEMTNR